MSRRAVLCSLTLVAVALTPGVAPADAMPPGEAGTPSLDSTGACASTHSFGSGATAFATCFTVDGNVTRFTAGAPGGASHEHIAASDLYEGYALCSNTTPVARDLAMLGETGFGPPTVLQPNGANSFPLTITRATTDGSFVLKQRFLATPSRVVTVTMTVTNTSAGSLAGVKVSRLVDADVDATTVDDTFVTTRRAALAIDNPGGGLLALTGTSRGRAVTASVAAFTTGDPDLTTCGNLDDASVLGPTDGYMKAVYNLGTIPAGESREVVYTYSGD